MTVLALWCLLAAFTHLAHARSSNSTTTSAPASTTETPTVTAAAPSTSTSYSASAEVTETPAGTVEAAGSTTSTTSTTTASTSSVDTAYICSGDEVARLTKLNENNPYLQSTCISSAGISSYVFPFNGELSYAQMVAMSAVSECGFYFRAVLLVQLQECVDANVYIRTTAETVLQLAATSGNAPSEAEVNAAIAVRKTYNLALRDGDGTASYSSMSGASSLSWNIEGDTIDTTASATITGQLLLSTDLHVVGTYYASSDSSASTTSTVEDSRTPGQSTDSSSAANRRGASPWLLALALACATLAQLG
jgi:hypothetical protein